MDEKKRQFCFPAFSDVACQSLELRFVHLVRTKQAHERDTMANVPL